jgi:hypothetical protein
VVCALASVSLADLRRDEEQNGCSEVDKVDCVCLSKSIDGKAGIGDDHQGVYRLVRLSP